MQVHASCAARDGVGVLFTGAPGSGKSDLVLRLLDCDFALVADDQVEIDGSFARAPAALAGLLEVRGLGIVRLPYLSPVRLGLVVKLGRGARLPVPETCFGLPCVHVDPAQASAPNRVVAALRCLANDTQLVAGAFA